MGTISTEILESYAADAAREVEGVSGVIGSGRPRPKGVRVFDEGGGLRVELRLAVAWGVSIRDVAAAVQDRVYEYLGRMADVVPERVDVIVEKIEPPLTIPGGSAEPRLSGGDEP